MSDESLPEQIAAVLVALCMRGETHTEIFAAAKTMRQLALKTNYQNTPLLDIVGTGGDQAGLFNISTATCFIVAAGGVKIAKHGNRSVSSRSGSADLLETAGAQLNKSIAEHNAFLENLGITFLFAPQFHSVMKKVAEVRKTLGIRTIFNLLGPLTNPYPITHHCIGVYDKKWLAPFAEVLKQFGAQKAVILHARDGLDEVSLYDITHVAELSQGEIKCYDISPEQFGFKRQALDALKVNNAGESLLLVKKVLNNVAGPWLDICLLNAGVAFYAAERVDDIASGIELAKSLIHNEKAKHLFQKFIGNNYHE